MNRILAAGAALAALLNLSQEVRAQNATLPTIGRNTAYAVARQKIIAAGYAPYHLQHRHLTESACLPGNNSLCKTYSETALWGVGGDCEFLFSKGPSEILIVHTMAENVSQNVVIDIRRSDKASVEKMY